MAIPDEVALTRRLLAYDTINPPGHEQDCARHLGGLLEAAGFTVREHAFADRRTSVIASIGGDRPRAPIVFTGHLDTVPLGTVRWKVDPFGADVDGDRLYGRGASDMKSGVAAMVAAACAVAPHLRGSAGVTLVLTAAEEGGCVGSRHLAQQAVGLLGRAGALVVGEPTSNVPHVGHKGTVKFHATFRGVAAHGSMPELGDNAIYKAACAACRLQGFRFTRPSEAGHPLMGRPTLNVGTIRGGDTINSVPDSAVLGVDIRTVAGMDHADVIDRIRETLGPDAGLDVFQDSDAVFTDPGDRWVRRVFDLCTAPAGAPPSARTLSYNTDAGNLRRVWPGVPVVVLGPGDAALAHQVDESCSIALTRAARGLYERLMRDWVEGGE